MSTEGFDPEFLERYLAWEATRPWGPKTAAARNEAHPPGGTRGARGLPLERIERRVDATTARAVEIHEAARRRACRCGGCEAIRRRPVAPSPVAPGREDH